MRSRFLINDETASIVDLSRHAYPDAPPELVGVGYLLCPHCGHDERDHRGPHEMFDILTPPDARDLPVVSRRHFRCRECDEVSPVWVMRRDGGVTSHLRERETDEACMPRGFDAPG